jgi:hypothetical protein
MFCITHSGGLTKRNVSQEHVNICAENESIPTSRVSVTAVSDEDRRIGMIVQSEWESNY